MKKFKKVRIIVLVLLLGLCLVVLYQLRDRNFGYVLDIDIAGNSTGKIKAGFAAVSITPNVPDTWTDIDGNARYEPDKGDTFTDGNNNGKFDPVWMAGFQNRRAANGIHDSLWARTMVVDDGNTRIALVAIDAIGFFHDQLLDVRKKLSDELAIDYCMVASTHVHEAPDLMGIWGESMFKSGVNNDYLNFVIQQIVQSVKIAVADIEEVSLHLSEDKKNALPLVKDTRKPVVYDPGMYIIQAKNLRGETKGVLVSWANHPETLWSKNLLITSDFPHYFREEIEKTVGGTCVYVNGAIGGLITTHPSLPVIHPETGVEYAAATFKKAEAQGEILANIAVSAMQNSSVHLSESAIKVQAKTFKIPFSNPMFRLGATIGLIDRGLSGWWKVRTEIAAIQIGPASILTIPGEIYPEIVNGGIETPEGADFEIQAVETPSLRKLMPGDFKFVFGLANDELGYIIPKSQWDNKEPWTYGNKELYGEENSIGPETGPIIYKQAKEILLKLK